MAPELDRCYKCELPVGMCLCCSGCGAAVSRSGDACTACATEFDKPPVLVDLPGGIVDWPATMRDCVAEASVLADRVAASDSSVGEALQRLCNVVVWLVDENDRLTKEVERLNDPRYQPDYNP